LSAQLLDLGFGAATFPEPRPFQQRAHDALRAAFKDGHKNQLIMAPTGAGKTYLGLRIAHEALAKGKRAVFVCDRTTLINQTSATADGYGLTEHGIIQADHWRANSEMKFQIASAQTLARRSWPECDVVIIDEAHTQLKVWVEYAKQCQAAVIGLSATPFSPGLAKIFSNLINATTMHELTQSGVLVPMRVFTCTRPDMTGAKIVAGEWSDDDVEERGLGIIGDVVTEWARFAEGRKTIVFGATIKHCEEICRQFVEAGVMASVFTSLTTPGEREHLLKEYRRPDSTLRVLVSVEALAKGFDVPDVGCVVDCRPLRKSLSTAIQMWGRGLRASPSTGKTDCILLDHSGNILRFADDYTDIYFNGLSKLDDGEKLDKKVRQDDEDREQSACPACKYKPFIRRCMACGFEIQTAALIEHEAGEATEVMLGKRKLADDKQHLYAQVCTYARANSAPEKQRGRAAHLFKDMTGDWPPRSFSFDATADIPITRNVLNQIRSMTIRYVKGRAKGEREAVAA
jgi:DNA repair protein RadD